MTDAEQTEEQAVNQPTGESSHFWPDETVDAIAAFAVVSTIIVMALWYVIG